MQFARTALLTLCAGLLAYQGEIKAQSVVVPSTKEARTNCSNKVAVPTPAEVKARSVVVPSTKETRTDSSNKVAAPTLARGRKVDFDVDKLDFAALGITRSNEDCGPDKGKCSGEGHCCLIGGSGWCCSKDKKCGEEIGECK